MRNERKDGLLKRFCLTSVVLAVFLCLGIPMFGQEQGLRFVAVAPDVLSNSNIRCFFKDSKGYMWIGTEGALIRYDGRNTFRYLNNPNDKTTIAHNTINTITEGPDKQLWIGTA